MFLLLGKRLTVIIGLILLASGLAFSAQASVKEPLLIVRHNQPNIYYSKSLYQAVKAAIDTKPDVRFTVVSFIPNTYDQAKNQQWYAIAEENTQRFKTALADIGVPLRQVRFEQQWQGNLEYHTIHLYVE